MFGRSDRVINVIPLLRLICLFILLGGNACGTQPFMAATSPVPSTAELPFTPLPSPRSTTMPTPPVEFKLVPHSEDAHLTTDLDGETAIIQIFSESGIGSADVEIVSEKLPKRIIMRFHLRGMERLRFTYNKTTVEVSLSKAEDNGVFESMVRRDDVTASEPITSDSPYWMNVRLVSNGVSPVTIPLQDGYIEVEVPPSFSVEENHQFSIQWIDFYR